MWLNLVLLEQRVVDRQHRAARIAEKVLHALILERLDHHFGAGHFPCHGRRPSLSDSYRFAMRSSAAHGQ